MNLPAPEPNLIDLFALPLHEAGIRYLVAGSVGSMHYSEPRLTLDIDIPLFVTHKDIPTILKCFSEPEYYCPPADVIASEIARDISKKFQITLISGILAGFVLLVWAFLSAALCAASDDPECASKLARIRKSFSF